MKNMNFIVNECCFCFYNLFFNTQSSYRRQTDIHLSHDQEIYLPDGYMPQKYRKINFIKILFVSLIRLICSLRKPS